MRAIDADALEKAISVSHSMIDDYGIKTGYEICMRLVENAPTIEPERKTGKWIKTYDGEDEWHECSECKYVVSWKPNYCPNCGARMKGEPNENR